MMLQPWKGSIQVTSENNPKTPEQSSVDIKIQRNQVESSSAQPVIPTQSPAPNSSLAEGLDERLNETQQQPSSKNLSENPAFNSQSPKISSDGVAFVIDPPSNIRQAPNGEIICTVPKPQSIPISDPQGDWYPTNFCGASGFIHASQLNFNFQPAWVIDPPSNVRSKPNGDIICSVPQKRLIDLYGQTDGWYRTNVCEANVIGYIHNSQITFD